MQTASQHIRRQKFTDKQLIINDQSIRAPYRRRSDDTKLAIHWGQRKLLIGEIEFFSIYWNPKLVPNPICVYAGAAPGTHISLLSEMFPSFTFHLYDPAEFRVKATEKIILHKEYFTDDVARQYAGRNDVFFLSDIRTADYKTIQNAALQERGITEFNPDGTPIGLPAVIKEAFKASEVMNEDQIWGDMNMQQEWVKIINPEHAFLKFRLPYALDGKDKTVQYLKGVVYWQVWAPQTSTETRLKPIRNDQGVYESADWSILEYEEWCFHNNTVGREKVFYENPFLLTNDPIDFPELLNDFDSVAEAYILKLYFDRLGSVTDIYDKVKNLSKLITLSINHYRQTGEGLISLSNMRISPVKSTCKTALDAFRSKRTGKPVKHSAFQHSKVEVNPTWRDPAALSRVPATAVVPVVTPPVGLPPISVPPPVVTPPTISAPKVITPPVGLPPISVPPPVVTPPTISAPKVITPPVGLPPISVPPPVVTPPTISAPKVTPPAVPVPRVTPPTVVPAPRVTPPVVPVPRVTPPAVPLPKVTPPPVQLPQVSPVTSNLPQINKPLLVPGTVPRPAINLPPAAVSNRPIPVPIVSPILNTGIVSPGTVLAPVSAVVPLGVPTNLTGAIPAVAYGRNQQPQQHASPAPSVNIPILPGPPKVNTGPVIVPLAPGFQPSQGRLPQVIQVPSIPKPTQQ